MSLERSVQLELFSYPYIAEAIERLHRADTPQNRYDLECYENRLKISCPILAQYIQHELELKYKDSH